MTRNKSTRTGNYSKRAAAVARRAKELAEKKCKQTPGPAEKQPPREDPYSRLLRKLDEDNQKK